MEHSKELVALSWDLVSFLTLPLPQMVALHWN